MLAHSIIYFLGSLLIRATSVILIPVYTRALSPADYGTLELLFRTTDILTLCLFLNGNRLAAMAFYNQSRDDDARKKAAFASIVFALASVVLIGGAAMALAGPLAAAIGVGSAWLLRLALLAGLVDSLLVVPMALMQARIQSLAFTAINVSLLLGRVALILVFVWFLRWGVSGVLLATLIVAGAFAVFLNARELGWTGWRVDREMFASISRFALPFLPAGFCGLLLNNGDQFFLVHYAGVAEVGIYALGYKLASVVSMLTRTPLYMVWSAQMYQAADEPDGGLIFGRMFKRINIAYAFVGLGVCLFSREIILFLGEPRYQKAAAIIPPVVLAYAFVTAADLMDGAFYVRRKTAMKTWITAASTVVMVLLYVLLIPWYGAMGAALATLAGFMFHAVVTYLVSQRIFRVTYEWPAVAGILGSAVLFWAISTGLQAGGATILLKGLLWISWPPLLWVTGMLSEDEKAQIKTAARDVVSRLNRRDPLEHAESIR